MCLTRRTGRGQGGKERAGGWGGEEEQRLGREGQGGGREGQVAYLGSSFSI